MKNRHTTVADSLCLRQFLQIGLDERTPDHVTIIAHMPADGRGHASGSVWLGVAAGSASGLTLVKEGLLDKVGGQVPPAAQQALGWEKTMSVPTPGVLVKGCLDDCDICEPELKKLMASARSPVSEPDASN